jgi:septal ring factor EnvC (AmiA/AmiB activator)
MCIMTEEVENLRRIDANVQELQRGQAEHGRRLNRIEAELGRLVRDRGDDIEARAELQAQVDRMREDIERIKRRLDLSDA